MEINIGFGIFSCEFFLFFGFTVTLEFFRVEGIRARKIKPSATFASAQDWPRLNLSSYFEQTRYPSTSKLESHDRMLFKRMLFSSTVNVVYPWLLHP